MSESQAISSIQFDFVTIHGKTTEYLLKLVDTEYRVLWHNPESFLAAKTRLLREKPLGYQNII